MKKTTSGKLSFYNIKIRLVYMKLTKTNNFNLNLES